MLRQFAEAALILLQQRGCPLLEREERLFGALSLVGTGDLPGCGAGSPRKVLGYRRSVVWSSTWMA